VRGGWADLSLSNLFDYSPKRLRRGGRKSAVPFDTYGRGKKEEREGEGGVTPS